MPNLNDVCEKISDECDYINAAAVIEKDSALLLGLGSNTDDFSLDYYETIAAAAVNIYQGRNIQTVEKMIAEMRGVPPTSSIEEAHLVMDNNSVYISSITSKPDILVFVMSSNETDMDLVWAELRNNLDVVSAAAP